MSGEQRFIKPNAGIGLVESLDHWQHAFDVEQFKRRHRQAAPPDEHQFLLIEIDPDRVEIKRHLAKHQLTGPLGRSKTAPLRHEAPRSHARQPRLIHRMIRVHLLEHERLVAAEIPLRPLILRRRHEVPEIKIGGEPRPMLADPAGVVFPHPLLPLRPGRWQGAKPSRQGLRRARLHPSPRSFEVGHRLAYPPAPERVGRIRGPSPRLVVRQRDCAGRFGGAGF